MDNGGTECLESPCHGVFSRCGAQLAAAPHLFINGNCNCRFESLAQAFFTQEFRKCADHLRHKTSMISPLQIQKAGIGYTTAVQVQNCFRRPCVVHWRVACAFLRTMWVSVTLIMTCRAHSDELWQMPPCVKPSPLFALEFGAATLHTSFVS